SVFKAKKYEVPLAVFQPFVAGGFAVAYLTSGRFSPAQGALVLTQDGNFDKPLTEQERKAYEKGLAEVTKPTPDARPAREGGSWHLLLNGARLELDAQGRPVLMVRLGEGVGAVRITRENVLAGDAPPEFVQELLVARLREQLKKGRAPKTSETELRQDW